jgi:hypothetical protein
MSENLHKIYADPLYHQLQWQHEKCESERCIKKSGGVNIKIDIKLVL